MLDFSTNLNFLGSPPKLLKYFSDISHEIERIPDYKCLIPRKVISDYYSVGVENIVLGAGATGLLYAGTRLINSQAMIFRPSFWEYEQFLVLNNVDLIAEDLFLHEDINFEGFIHGLADKLNKHKPKITFICNPNNPTGAKYEKDRLLHLIRCNPETIFVVDETYLLFERDYWTSTLSGDVETQANLIVIKSLSKFYCVPGIRAGIAFSSKSLCEQLLSKMVPYSVTTPTQLTVKWIIENCQEYETASRFAYEDCRSKVVSVFSEVLHDSLEILSGQANAFVLFKVRKNDVDADKIKDAMEGIDILVRSGTEIKGLGNSYFRISVKDVEDMMTLANALKSFFLKNR
jgi:threonine-phosphate decarboxylase